MVDEDALAPRLQAFQPLHAFPGQQGWRHAHVRPAVASQEPPSACLELEALISEDLTEGVAAALGPLGVVVSGNHPVPVAQGVQHTFRGAYFLVGAEVGDVSAEDYEVQGVLTVDVFYALPQVGHRMGAFGQMGVGQEGETQQRRRN